MARSSRMSRLGSLGGVPLQSARGQAPPTARLMRRRNRAADEAVRASPFTMGIGKASRGSGREARSPICGTQGVCSIVATGPPKLMAGDGGPMTLATFSASVGMCERQVISPDCGTHRRSGRSKRAADW